jgi:hypothetical protein
MKKRKVYILQSLQKTYGSQSDIVELLIHAKLESKPGNKLKTQCKKNIMFAIGESRNGQSLLEIKEVVRQQNKYPIAAGHKERIRENLMEAIRTKRPSIWSQWVFSFKLWRNMIATGLTCVLVIVAMQLTVKNVPHTRASGMYLNIIYGGAAVSYNNSLKKASNSQSIGVNDTIVTGKDSFVELKLFDHSVVRLGDNTSLRIVNVTPSEEIVTLQLEGTAWVRTLEDRSHVNIRTASSTSISVPKGVVSIESNDRVTRVLTKENVALVEVGHSDQGTITTQTVQVLQDQVAYIPVSSPGTDITSRPVRVGKILDPKWVQENEEQDKNYLASIKAEKKEEIIRNAGALPGSPLYPAKIATEKAKLSLLVNEARPNAQLASANIRLQEALALQAEGRQTEAMAIFQEYKSAITLVFIAATEELYGVRGKELVSELKNHIADAQGKLKFLANPADPVYEIKTFVDSYALKLAHNKERISEKDQIAQSKLYQVLEVLDRGDDTLALQLFTDYADITQEAFDEAHKLQRAGDSTLIQKMVRQKTEIELPLLTLIEQKPLLSAKASELRAYIQQSADSAVVKLSKENQPISNVNQVTKVASVAPVEVVSKTEIAEPFKISGVAKKPIEEAIW